MPMPLLLKIMYYVMHSIEFIVRFVLSLKQGDRTEIKKKHQ